MVVSLDQITISNHIDIIAEMSIKSEIAVDTMMSYICMNDCMFVDPELRSRVFKIVVTKAVTKEKLQPIEHALYIYIQTASKLYILK